MAGRQLPPSPGVPARLASSRAARRRAEGSRRESPGRVPAVSVDLGRHRKTTTSTSNQAVLNGTSIAASGPALSGPRGPVTPVFKLCFHLCFGGSGPFVGVCDLGASALPLAADRSGPPVLLSLWLSATAK